MQNINVGDIILSTPANQLIGMQKSIIFVVSVTEYIIGVIINKPVKGVPLSNFMPNHLSQLKGHFYFGGPSFENSHLLIHTFSKLPFTNLIKEGLYYNINLWVNSPLFLLNEEQAIIDSNFRCYFGYCMWDVAHLSNGINEGLFFVLPSNSIENIFENLEDKWENLIQ